VERAPTPTGDGTFIQNITNNIIMDNESQKPDQKNEQGPKEPAKKPVAEQQKCHCHLSQTGAKQQNPYGHQGNPMMYYPWQMMPMCMYPPYGFNPYMHPYGMPPHHQHPGQHGHWQQQCSGKSEGSRLRSPDGKSYSKGQTSQTVS